MIAKPTYTNKQASEYLSISQRTLYNLRKRGLIKCYKVGSRNYFTKEQLDDFIKTSINNYKEGN